MKRSAYPLAVLLLVPAHVLGQAPTPRSVMTGDRGRYLLTSLDPLARRLAARLTF